MNALAPRSALLLAASVSLLAPSLASAEVLASTSGADAEAPVLVPRPPILIEGDAGFLLPTSGVTNPLAAGTADDPYVIRGWSLAAPPGGLAVGQGAALTMRDTTKFVVIENVRVSTLDDLRSVGMWITNATHVTIRNVQVAGTLVFAAGISNPSLNLYFDGQGILVDGASRDVTIEDNVLDNGFNGIVIGGGASDVRIEDNTVLQHRSFGIVAWEAGANMTVAANHVANTGVAIGLYRGTAVIERNVIDSSGGGIALLFAAGVRVEGNTMRDNTRYGIFAVDTHASRLTGNLVEHAAWDGLILEGSRANVISGNAFQDSAIGLWALASRSTGARPTANVIEHNDFKANSQALLLDKTDGARVLSNSLCLNGAGIALTNSPNARVNRNAFASNDVGLRASGSGNVDATLNWWGSANGPGSPNADRISGSVTASPWLSTPDPDAGSPFGLCG